MFFKSKKRDEERIRISLSELERCPGRAVVILELWAEKSDVQEMVWGGPKWKDTNPNMAEELEAIAKLIGKQQDEILRLKQDIENS